ncbi:MAG: GTP cyclohydrolase I FolE, partial [Flavobacteriaceae bacterium]
ISDTASSTVTSEFGGVFNQDAKKREFLDYIQLDTSF